MFLVGPTVHPEAGIGLRTTSTDLSLAGQPSQRTHDRMHSKIPVDTTLPEVENKMVVTMIMEVRNRRGQVAMKISRRAETHNKMELLKTKR